MDHIEHFLVIHNDYIQTIIGLFCADTVIDQVTSDNKRASKNFFVLLDDLLARNKKSIQDCLFIGVNQGPGPFTTLRVSIAAANGLAYSTQRPLVGINSIETMVKEYRSDNSNYTLALSNAFCNDVYYAIISHDESYLASGCLPFNEISSLFDNLTFKNEMSNGITCIGNCAEKCTELFVPLQMSINIPNPCPAAASLQAMGKQAYHQWQTHTHVVNQVLPLYLKSAAPEIVQ